MSGVEREQRRQTPSGIKTLVESLVSWKGDSQATAPIGRNLKASTNVMPVFGIDSKPT